MFSRAYWPHTVFSADNCKNVTCREAGQTCVTDQYKKSHCISCDSVCSNAAEVAVCGTDGITYKDECDLRRKACRARKNTSIAYYQPCLRKSLCPCAIWLAAGIGAVWRRDMTNLIGDTTTCATPFGGCIGLIIPVIRLQGTPFHGAIDESVGGRGAEG